MRLFIWWVHEPSVNVPLCWVLRGATAIESTWFAACTLLLVAAVVTDRQPANDPK
ncbi:MAG: hypothetical protein J0I06_06735 [Planctomycetes bacterium]|nr:hypothetical protein [Planctomycetota bacterium]